MKLKRPLFIFISITIVIAIAYILNGFFGNLISKESTKQEVISYYEVKYNKEFVVYSMVYNPLIPDYNIKMGPKDEAGVIFETSKYELTMYDSYGAFLASEELKGKILKFLVNEYPELKLRVDVDEEHHIDVVGVKFDFFSPDPNVRLEKNYFLATLSMMASGLSHDETIKLMDEIAFKINEELIGIPQHLSLDILVTDKTGDLVIQQRFYTNGKAILKA